MISRAGTLVLLGLALSPGAGAATQITVEKIRGGPVVVRYELPVEVAEIVFDVDAPLIRADYWEVDAPFRLDGDRVHSPKPFRRLTARLRPNDRFMDRMYASLVTLDETTAVVNIDYIRPKDAPVPVTITLQNAYDPVAQTCVRSLEIASAIEPREPGTAGRYALLSSSWDACLAQAENAGNRIFVSRSISPALAALVSGTFIPIYRALTSEFSIVPEPEPTIFLSWNRAATENTFQGDVGWQSVISLRFYGNAWANLNDGSSSDVSSFLTHELVHLWIGKLADIDGPDESQHPWLHEGAAEYISLLTLVQQGLMSKRELATQVGSYLNSCGHELGEGSLMTERQPEGGNLIYDCGVLVQFAYDVVSRTGTRNETSIVDLWSRLIRESLEDESRVVKTEDFVNSLPAAEGILASVLYGPQADVRAIATALRPFGVESETTESTDIDILAPAMLVPLLHADCKTGAVGFWTHEDRLVLDANESCQTIPGGFVLRYVQGIDLMEQPGAAYDEAARVCAEGGSVRIAGRTSDEPEITLPCPGPLPARPLDIEIRDVGFLDD